MARILVGIDGSPRGERALEWAARRAERDGSSLTLVTVSDPRLLRGAGLLEADVEVFAQQLLFEAKDYVAQNHPSVSAESIVAKGAVVDALVEQAQGHDLVVLGSHHGATVGETIGGAKGLRVSVCLDVPTVIVPADWHFDEEKHGVLVGFDPEGFGEEALRFGIGEAVALRWPLRLVTAWGLPAWISRPAEMMGGGLSPIGEQYQRVLDEHVERIAAQHGGLEVSGKAVEGPFPSRVLIDSAKENGMLVMGTHSRKALGRAVFGSVTHSVLLNLVVPTVIVPRV
ncbi:universal stress protein [Slackia sp.]|uniref:universal stress protein n=1 Tax=Slackia sp. TaxID=2049041 RepID=UPI00399AB72D